MYSHWWQDPNWYSAIGTFLAAIVALLIALFGNSYLDWRNKPKIKLGLYNEEPHVITDYSGRISTLAKLFRINVINEGKTVAKNCRIKVLSISPEPDVYFEPDLLKWSSALRDMRYRIDQRNIVNPDQLIPVHKETKDISPQGGSEFCDLFYFGSVGHEVYFVSSGNRKFLAREDSYFATIEICGDNIQPKRARFRISEIHNYMKTRIDWV